MLRTGFEARSSVVEAGRCPTDETDENFVHPAFGRRIGLRYELRQRQTIKVNQLEISL
jgi:hypothetical protein